MVDKKVQEWSSRRLQGTIKERVTKMFESILDFSEVAVGEEKRYKVLRAKILRVSNDAMRDIVSEIAQNYTIEYCGINQDVVKVQTGQGDKNDR